MAVGQRRGGLKGQSAELVEVLGQTVLLQGAATQVFHQLIEAVLALDIGLAEVYQADNHLEAEGVDDLQQLLAHVEIGIVDLEHKFLAVAAHKEHLCLARVVAETFHHSVFIGLEQEGVGCRSLFGHSHATGRPQRVVAIGIGIRLQGKSCTVAVQHDGAVYRRRRLLGGMVVGQTDGAVHRRRRVGRRCYVGISHCFVNRLIRAANLLVVLDFLTCATAQNNPLATQMRLGTSARTAVHGMLVVALPGKPYSGRFLRHGIVAHLDWMGLRRYGHLVEQLSQQLKGHVLLGIEFGLRLAGMLNRRDRSRNGTGIGLAGILCQQLQHALAQPVAVFGNLTFTLRPLGQLHRQFVVLLGQSLQFDELRRLTHLLHQPA